MKNKLVLKKSYTSKQILNKYKNKSIDTIILKDRMYNGKKYYENDIAVKNLEIVYKSPKMYIGYPHFTFIDTKSENVYFKNEENLGGITLSLDHLMKNNITHIDFEWNNNKDKPSNINWLNIITYSKEPIKINLIPEFLKEINIKLSTDHKLTLDIRIKSTNSEKMYEIDFDGELKETIIHYIITEKDLINGELNLTKFNNLEVVTLDNIEIDTLTINKNQINNLKDIKLYDDVYIEKIKVIDNNDMKLNPVAIIPFNDTLDIWGKYIIGDREETLIYVDSKDNLQVFNKLEILKDKTIEKVEFLDKLSTDKEIIIICKYKKNYKYKIIIDYGYFNIDKLFTLYLKERNYSLKSYNWIEIMDDSLTISNFIDLANDYLDFKINIRKLLDYGFSYKYLMYLHKKGLDSVIFEMCKKDFDLNKFSKEEVEELNKIGKKYVKKLN